MKNHLFKIKKILVIFISVICFFSVTALGGEIKSSVVSVDGTLPILNLPMLEKLAVFLEDQVIKLEMEFSQDIQYSDFLLQNPPRVVVDVSGGWYLNRFQQITYHDPLLHQVRYFHYRDGLRIVAELNYTGPRSELIWDDEKKTLTMIIHRRFTKKESTTIVPGLEYHYIKTGLKAGPVTIHALEVQLNPYTAGQEILQEIGAPYPIPELALKTTFLRPNLQGFCPVSRLVAQELAIAGINGGFFAADGFPLGLLIQDGQLVSAPLLERTAWGIDQDGKMYMDQISLKGEAVINYFSRQPLSSLNRPRYADELILYTPTFGPTTNTNQWGKEIIVENNRIVGINAGNSSIPGNGFVISAHGVARDFLKNVQLGDLVQVFLDMSPNWLSQGIIQAIGGGPRLVENGFLKITGKEEKFRPDILEGRAPRSALGITADNHLLMVTVDGRSEHSIGMTLEELADLTISLGAVEAMNLDGGKSSTLVINDKVINTPARGEISVHNGLVIKIKEKNLIE